MDNFTKCEGEIAFGDIDVLLGVIDNLIDGGFLKKIKPKSYQWQNYREIEGEAKSNNDLVSAVDFSDFSLNIGGCLYSNELAEKVVKNILPVAESGYFLTQKGDNTEFSRWHNGKTEAIFGGSMSKICTDCSVSERDSLTLTISDWMKKYNVSHENVTVQDYLTTKTDTLTTAWYETTNSLSKYRAQIPDNAVADIIKLEVAKKFFEMGDTQNAKEAAGKYDAIAGYIAGDAEPIDIEHVDFLDWLEDDITIDTIFELMETEYKAILLLLQKMDALYQLDASDAESAVYHAEIEWELRGSVVSDCGVLQAFPAAVKISA